jgi:hypothetical protein
LTSAGDAFSTHTPSGGLAPSSATISFVLLPHLVVPIPWLRFWPPQTCRPRSPRSSGSSWRR